MRTEKKRPYPGQIVRRRKWALSGLITCIFFAAALLYGCGSSSAAPQNAASGSTAGTDANAAAKPDTNINAITDLLAEGTSPKGEDAGTLSGPKESAASSAGEASSAGVGSSASAEDLAKLSPLERYFRDDHFWDGCPERNVQLLTPNEYSRPGTDLEEVNDIVVHYVDEPGSTAMQNRDYFESLKDGSGRSVSSHFIISLDGEIIQCVPLGEVAYASNHRNRDTISIECCHPDETGEFTEETYRSCVNLCAWLCYAFGITPDHVIRHYDVTEKICPKYYVDHPDAWEYMKKKIAEKYDEYVTEYGKRI